MMQEATAAPGKEGALLSFPLSGHYWIPKCAPLSQKMLSSWLLH